MEDTHQKRIGKIVQDHGYRMSELTHSSLTSEIRFMLLQAYGNDKINKEQYDFLINQVNKI